MCYRGLCRAEGASQQVPHHLQQMLADMTTGLVTGKNSLCDCLGPEPLQGPHDQCASVLLAPGKTQYFSALQTERMRERERESSHLDGCEKGRMQICTEMLFLLF